MEYITNTSRELNGKYPDKSIDLLENVCADTVWRGGKTFGKKDIKRIAEELLEKQQILETIQEVIMQWVIFKELFILLTSLIFCFVGHKCGYDIVIVILLVRIWIEQKWRDD